MSNPVSTLWSAVDASIAANRTTLGITDSARGEAGKASTLRAPGVISWVDFESAVIDTHAGKPVSISAKCLVFCVGAGGTSAAAAVDSTLEIALAVVALLAGASLGGTVLVLASNPLDIIEANANRPVISVTFDCVVPL